MEFYDLRLALSIIGDNEITETEKLSILQTEGFDLEDIIEIMLEEGAYV